MAKRKTTTITDPNFETLKNLAFWHGHQPTYFYFKSLVNYKSNNPMYAAKAAEVASAGEQFLTNNALDIDQQGLGEDSPAMKKLAQVLAVLRKAITYERSNELRYFKQKLAMIKSNFSPEEIAAIHELGDLEKLLDANGEFQYIDFLNIVNALMQGVKTTKTIAQYEAERLTQVDAAMNKIREVHENRLKGLNKKMRLTGTEAGDKLLTKGMDKFNRKIEITYLENGNLYGTATRKRNGKKASSELISGVQKYLDPVKKTVDVQLGKWITTQVNNIASNGAVMEQLTKFVQGWYLSQLAAGGEGNIKNVESQIKGIIIQCFCDYGAKHLPEILSGVYDQLSDADLANIMSESLESVNSYKITGLYSNFGQFGLTLDLFKEANTIDDLRSGEQLYEALSRLRESIRRYRRDSERNKLSREQRIFIKAMGVGKTDKDEYNEIMKAIEVLEDIQKKYEAAQNKHKNWITKIEGVRNKHIKDKNGGEVTITVKLEKGKITNLGEIKQVISKIQGFNKFGRYASDLSAQSLQGLIQGLKTRVSHQLKKDIIRLVKENSKGNKSKESELIAAYRDGLQGMSISVSGPAISELRQSLLQQTEAGIVSNYQTGKINRKNDVVTVVVSMNEAAIAKKMSSTIDIDANGIADTLASSQDEIANSYASEFSKYLYSELAALNNAQDHSHNSYKKNADLFFDYQKKQEQQFDAMDKGWSETAKLWEAEKANMESAGKSADDIAKRREQIFDSLKNSFFISSTMKTYNQYQNNIGFKGGSLGANLLEQLDNLEELFNESGIDFAAEDKEWLLGAIINCSPASIIGERNKNIIENYLGSMAAFALFDEGGAELRIIESLDNPDKSPINSSPDILHLYVVNGVYVPGSFVLERTCQELEECLKLGTMALKMGNQGASVQIRNTMTENNIPNRGKGGITDSDPWGSVASRAINNVSIKVVFLGGLLDILNSMNSKLGNLTLPG